MPETLIETRNIVKQYGKFVAVNNVSFDVRAGEVFGFLGPNGAGKTTTIKMIVGLLQPTSGTVKVAGYDVQSQGLLAKASSGYVPDTPNLYAKLTGRELLRFVGDLYDVDRKLASHRIEDLLRTFDLADAADETLDSYSHGMQQKASLAAALMHDPKVLVLDEPTVGLDPKSARLIKDILRQLADRGAAVMLSTHILEIAERMCDRIGIINKGELVAVGTMDELRGQGQGSLEDIFLGLTGGAESAEIAEISQMSIPHTPSRALLPAVTKLLMLRLRINLNSFRHAKLRTRIFTVVGTVALTAFAAFLFWLSWQILAYVSSPKLVIYTGINGGRLMDAMPVTIFTFMFMGILFTSFGVLLQALYLSGDMDFLLAAPVPIRAVFFAKLLQAVLPNFAFMAFFGLPLLYGMGAARGYNFFYYPLLLLVMVALTLAAAGLSSLLVMLVVRVIPARRVAEVLGFFGATISIICSQSGNLMNLRRGSAVSTGQLNNLIELQTRINSPWFPLNWAGRGLVELGSGNWLAGIVLVALTLALFTGIFWFALVTAERWYYTGWAGMQVVARKKRAVSAPPPDAAPRGTVFSLLGRFLPAPTRGLIQKDFLVLRRDLRNLSQLVTPLIFGVIYAASFMRRGGPSSSDDVAIFIRPLLAYANVGVALFVGWNLLIRLGGIAFSMEGKNYWLLKVAPLRASQLILAKFLVAYLPALTMGTVFMLVISIIQQVPLASFFYGLLVMVFCLIQMTGVLLAFGAAGANLTWDDPRKMNSGLYGCFGILATVAVTLIAFALFVGPLVLVSFLNYPEIFGYFSGFLMGSLFCVGAALGPLWLVRKKVERLGEA